MLQKELQFDCIGWCFGQFMKINMYVKVLKFEVICEGVWFYKRIFIFEYGIKYFFYLYIFKQVIVFLYIN